jgi:hemimethylated DNA binding protein
MGIDDLAHGRAQPFYHVLIDRRDEEQTRGRGQSTLQYVAQELLAPRELSTDDFEHTHKDEAFAGFDPRTGIYVMTADVAPSPA